VKALLTLYEGSVSALSAPSSPLRVPDSLLSHCILMQEKGQYDLHLFYAACHQQYAGGKQHIATF
jgi:hypothetical protein